MTLEVPTIKQEIMTRKNNMRSRLSLHTNVLVRPLVGETHLGGFKRLNKSKNQRKLKTKDTVEPNQPS